MISRTLWLSLPSLYRSTFCSVMAQLTEETQPSFETTLKSRAVSENCNVKFSCVVTGKTTDSVKVTDLNIYIHRKNKDDQLSTGTGIVINHSVKKCNLKIPAGGFAPATTCRTFSFIFLNKRFMCSYKFYDFTFS